jgi:hypothetical protein
MINDKIYNIYSKLLIKFNNLFLENLKHIQETLKKVEYANATGELKTELENKTIFGLNKNIILFSGLIIISAIAYKFYKSKK